MLGRGKGGGLGAQRKRVKENKLLIFCFYIFLNLLLWNTNNYTIIFLINMIKFLWKEFHFYFSAYTVFQKLKRKKNIISIVPSLWYSVLFFINFFPLKFSVKILQLCKRGAGKERKKFNRQSFIFEVFRIIYHQKCVIITVNFSINNTINASLSSKSFFFF